jgi:alpha 1,3-glucosidase
MHIGKNLSGHGRIPNPKVRSSEYAWLTTILRSLAGPESLSLDISFPHHANVYGIPSHASPLSLPTTTGADPTYSDPYRLYNLDVFQYDADSPMSLYGAIPLLHAHSEKSTVGVWNVLASETWIDVSHPTFDSTSTHWISESGILDLFLLPGPTSPDVFSQYTALTGTPYLPPLFSIAYHQCRWNYITSDDVRSVAKRFDEEDMPLDVIWLDIEYSEEHKYFMWNDKMFPDPVEMVNDVASAGRKVCLLLYS